jgi:hypothetical protein
MKEQKNTITSTTYAGHSAFILSDGKTEAVIVPALSGRVMRYGLIGGENILWNNPSTVFKPEEWHNYGGDKSWPALQNSWGMYQKSGGWPPQPTWDGDAHQATVVGNTLQVRGPVMKGYGVRSTRAYSMDSTGRLVIGTTFRREAGTDACQTAIWNVTQVSGMEAVFVLLNPQSPYKNNYHWFGPNKPAEAKTETLPGNILRFIPTVKGGGFKLGADSPVSTLIGVKKGVAFVVHAEKKEGEYPEGIPGSGLPVTLYNGGSDDPKFAYVEMEMMSPLTFLWRGDSLTHTVTWQLAPLASAEVNTFETHKQIARLLAG